MPFTELSKPRLLKVTQSLARRFRDMERFPRDRDLKPGLLEHLRNVMKSGEYRGSEWVSAYCKETEQTYRVNGKHTSHLACELLENGHKLDATVLVREYQCETLEEVARLYATFDERKSARTKPDIIRSFAATSDKLAEVPTRLLSRISAGLAYNLWEANYSDHDATEQALLMLQHEDCVVWASDILRNSSGNAPSKHLFRMAVIAAMARTWHKARVPADVFWKMLRDDCDLPKDSAPRKLYRWLLSRTLSRTAKTTQNYVTEREVMVRCLHGWNAWRRQEPTDLRYYADKPIPAVA